MSGGSSPSGRTATCSRYCYVGNGESDRSGAAGWLPNSGNAIGNGWGGFQHFLGGGDEVAQGVQPDGALLWYQYSGDGTADRSGAIGGTPGRPLRSAGVGSTSGTCS